MGFSESSDRLRRLVRVGPSPIHGQGCFARVALDPGDHIGTFEGPLADTDGPHVLWVYDAERGELIGREGRNPLRWLNHDEDPNAEFDGFDLYARRSILVGEEITIQYSAGA